MSMHVLTRLRLPRESCVASCVRHGFSWHGSDPGLRVATTIFQGRLPLASRSCRIDADAIVVLFIDRHLVDLVQVWLFVAELRQHY